MRLACPNRRFMNSRPMRPNDPTITPASRKRICARSAITVYGSASEKSGRASDPRKAKIAITAGKSANQRPPKTVDWIRHSSFIIARKRSGTGVTPHQVEEERLQVPA